MVMINTKRGGIIMYIIVAIAIFFVLNHFGITAGKLEGIFNTAWYQYAKPVLIAIYELILKAIIIPAGQALRKF